PDPPPHRPRVRAAPTRSPPPTPASTRSPARPPPRTPEPPRPRPGAPATSSPQHGRALAQPPQDPVDALRLHRGAPPPALLPQPAHPLNDLSYTRPQIVQIHRHHHPSRRPHRAPPHTVPTALHECAVVAHAVELHRCGLPRPPQVGVQYSQPCAHPAL